MREAWEGAVIHPTGIDALKLVGSYLTSTWISFDSRSEGDETPVRPKGSNYFGERSFEF